MLSRSQLAVRTAVSVLRLAKSSFFLAYQIWKPQFLSVVQFPFDNCYSLFSLTTFFEIGVYIQLQFDYGLKNQNHPIWPLRFQSLRTLVYISNFKSRCNVMQQSLNVWATFFVGWVFLISIVHFYMHVAMLYPLSRVCNEPAPSKFSFCGVRHYILTRLNTEKQCQPMATVSVTNVVTHNHICPLIPFNVEATFMFTGWSAKSHRQKQHWRKGGGEEY